VHPQFLVESMNVFLGLCIDEFNSFRSFSAPYFCWSVILTVYNMSSRMCMMLEFMFYLWSYPVLIVRVEIYMFIFDCWLMSWSNSGNLGLWLMMYRRNKIFWWRQFLCGLSMIFPAYGVVFGWSTHEKLAYLYCMENTEAFTLTNNSKMSFFTTTYTFFQQIISTERTRSIVIRPGLTRWVNPRPGCSGSWPSLFH